MYFLGKCDRMDTLRQIGDMCMNLIAAADENWAIGKDGGLLAHLPGDMKFFRETTKEKVVVMGRKTLESFPGKKPLKNRVNIVLTRNTDYAPEGVTLCGSVEEALNFCTALVSLKMETPGPFKGTREDVLAYMKEFY